MESRRAQRVRRGVWTVEYLMCAVAVLIAIIWAVTSWLAPAQMTRMGQAKQISDKTTTAINNVIKP
jgi:hypothetical protein